MMKTLRTMLVTAAAFFAGHVAITALLAAWQFAAAPPARDAEGYLMMLYITVFSGTASAFAFAAVTACSRRWRQRGARPVVIVSGIAGALALAGTWVGLFVPLLALLHAGFGSLAAIRIALAVPGLVLGLLVLAWSLLAKPHAGPQVG